MFVGGALSDAAVPLAGTALIVVGWVVVLLTVRARRPRDIATDDSAMLRVHHLTKRYGARTSLRDISFAVQRGCVVALLGPNGAGKTTLLRAIAGLIHPSAGSAYVMGRRITPGAAVLARVGVAIEEPGLAPHLSGRANLEFLWRASGRPMAEAQLELAAELAGLTPYLDRRASDYSQGMKQRLALAGAMLGLPELLLLDEPTNGLDPTQTRELGATLARYADSGRTVVLASHHLAEVDDVCTDVLVLHEGELRWCGPVSEVQHAAGTITVGVADPAGALRRLTSGAAWQALPHQPQFRVGARTIVIDLCGNTVRAVLAAVADSGVPVDSVRSSSPVGDLYRELTAKGSP